MMISLKRSIYLFIFIGSFSILAIQSCKVKFVPDYDASAVAQIESTAKMVDRFYLTMAETTTAEEGREYANFAQGYVDVEVELNAMLNKNKVRPLNKLATENCQILLDTWIEKKEKHKAKNTVKDAMIENYRANFSRMFNALLQTEKANEMAG